MRTVVINIIIYHVGWRTLSLRMPKLQENFTTLSYRVSSLRETRSFCKCFRHFLLKTLKNFLKNLFTSKIKKNQRGKNER